MNKEETILMELKTLLMDDSNNQNTIEKYLLSFRDLVYFDFAREYSQGYETKMFLNAKYKADLHFSLTESDLDQKNRFGVTLYHISAYSNYEPFLHYLIRNEIFNFTEQVSDDYNFPHNSDIRHLSKGWNILHICIYYSSSLYLNSFLTYFNYDYENPIIKTLLHQKDKNGMTPIYLAISRRSYTSITSILMIKGYRLNYDEVDDRGKTLFQLAKEKHILDYLINQNTPSIISLSNMRLD